MWIIGIAILGFLIIFNAIYRFLPKCVTENSCVKFFGVITALFLACQVIGAEIIKYNSYSYVEVLKNGEIKKSKNFKYKVEKRNDSDGTPYYIILGKFDLDNLGIKTTRTVTPDISVIVPGVKIRFVTNKSGNLIIPSDFKIEIKK